MAKFKTASSDSIISITETKPYPVPGSLQQYSSTCIIKTERQEKVKRAFPFNIISSALSALSNPKTHSPVQ